MLKTIAIFGSSEVSVAQRLQLDATLKSLVERIKNEGMVALVGTGGGVGAICAGHAKTLGVQIVGISPCSNAEEHRRLLNEEPGLYGLMIYSGVGYKGRNIILARSADAVVAIQGGMGTLHELATAWDEGKIVGVVRGSEGTAAALFPGIVDTLPTKNGAARLVSKASIEEVMDGIIDAHKMRNEAALHNASVGELFRRAGAIQEGHFEITSGHHTSEYWEKARALKDPRIVQEFARRLASKIRQYATQAPKIIASPAIGGVIVGQQVAAELDCDFIFFEKDKRGTLQLSRGYQLERSAPIAIVDDIVSTGHSIATMQAVLKNHGLDCVGSFVLVDRRGGTPRADRVSLQQELVSLLEKPEPKNIDARHCLLCKNGPAVQISKQKNVTVRG
ncbi:MAG: phosphoribosyltransferase family protein [Sedimenticola sp.]